MLKHDIIKFIKKILLFLPLTVPIGAPIFVLYVSGELVSVPQVLQIQENRDNPALIGLAYTNFMSYYKLEAVNKFHPDIITLGDSRCLPIRSVFFSKGTKFFNACNSILKVSDYEEFLDRIPKGQEPKLILLCLDHKFFNSKLDDIQKSADYTDDANENTMPFILGKLWQDYIDKKFTLRDIFNFKRNHLYGLTAIETNAGFRNDGSYRFLPSFETQTMEFRKKALEKELAQGHDYPFSSEAAPSALYYLIKFLDECNSRNIQVIGYLPSYAHFQVEDMRAMGDKESFMFKLAPDLAYIFSKFKLDFFDFTDLGELGASDEEMYDDVHSSEKANLRLFISMILQNKELMQYAKDPSYLDERLSKEKGSYYVFKENEF